MRTSRQRLETEGEMGTSPPFCPTRSPRGRAFFPKLFTAVYIMFPHFTSLTHTHF